MQKRRPKARSILRSIRTYFAVTLISFAWTGAPNTWAEPNDSVIQRCIDSVPINPRHDFDKELYAFRASHFDIAPCTDAAKKYPNNIQIKGLLAFAQLEQQSISLSRPKPVQIEPDGSPGPAYTQAEFEAELTKARALYRTMRRKIADIASAAKAGDPFSLYYYGRFRRLYESPELKVEVLAKLGPITASDRTVLERAARSGYPEAAYFLSGSSFSSRIDLYGKSALRNWRNEKANKSVIATAKGWLEMAVARGHREATGAFVELLATKELSNASGETLRALGGRMISLVETAYSKGDDIFQDFDRNKIDNPEQKEEQDTDILSIDPDSLGMKGFVEALHEYYFKELSDEEESAAVVRLAAILENSVSMKGISRNDFADLLRDKLSANAPSFLKNRLLTRAVSLLEQEIADPTAMDSERNKARRELGTILISGQLARQDIERGVKLLLDADRAGVGLIGSDRITYDKLQELGLCSPAWKWLTHVDLKSIKELTGWGTLKKLWTLHEVSRLSPSGCVMRNEADLTLLETLSNAGYPFAALAVVRALTDGKLFSVDLHRALEQARAFQRVAGTAPALNLILSMPSVAYSSSEWAQFSAETVRTAESEVNGKGFKTKVFSEQAELSWLVGQTTLFGLGTRRDVKRGFKLIKQSAANYNNEAKEFLLLSNLRTSATPDEWTKSLREAINYRRDGIVMRAIARAVSRRGGSMDSLPKILSSFLSTASHARKEPFLRLGNIFLDGLGVPATPAIAAKLFRSRAEEGDPAASSMLAVLHIRGVGVPQDLGEAHRLLEVHSTSSTPELAYARALLNRALGNDHSVIEQDLALADASDFQMASFELALKLVADQTRTAEGWSKIEALDQAGYAAASFVLGERFRKGQGVPKSLGVARFFYDRADRQQLLEAGLVILALAAEAGEPDLLNQVGLFMNRFDPGVDNRGEALDGLVPPNVIGRLATAYVHRNLNEIRALLREITATFDSSDVTTIKFAVWNDNIVQDNTNVVVDILQRIVQQLGSSGRSDLIKLASGEVESIQPVSADLTASQLATAARAAAVLDKKDEALSLRTAEFLARQLSIDRQYGGGTNFFSALKEAELWYELSREAYSLDRHNAATFFAKRAVNLLQEARSKLSNLDEELQRAFVSKHQDYYRWLANLFIETGRLTEAEFTLRLLKEFELHEYVRREGANPNGSNERIPYSTTEDGINATIGPSRGLLVEMGLRYQFLADTEKTRPLTVAEQEEREQLRKEMDTAAKEFSSYITALTAAIEEADRPTQRDADERHILEDKFESIAPTLANAFHYDAVALHYVVLPDRVSIMLTTGYGPQKAWTIPITLFELAQRVVRFREALMNPTGNPISEAEYLYDKLLRPAEDEIRASKAHTLLVSLDRILRYMPFSALHNGKQYVAEQYQVVGLIEAGTKRLHEPLDGPIHIAAFASTQPGGDGLEPLKFAKIEAESLVRQKPGSPGLAEGKLYIDGQFTRDAFKHALEMSDIQVVHAATHFVLVPGQEKESFLLLGDGTRFSVADLKELRAPPAFLSLDLFALSACETALPTADRSGSEVESFGALAMFKGARSVLATLWAVADPSTAAFMRKFYELRLAGRTKGDAIAETQRAFIKGEISPELNPGKWSHPYYWAPFLLMGNFL